MERRTANHGGRFICRGIVTAALGTLSVVSLAAQQTPRHEAARQALIDLEDQWLNASDLATLDRILADDFIHVLPVGFVTKAEELSFRKSHGFPDSDEVKRFEDLRVRLYGNTGIVNGIVVATKKAGGAVRRTRFTDVFVYRNGQWQAVGAQETPVQAAAR